MGDPRISHHDCESSLCRTAGILGVSPKKGCLFGGPYSQDYSTSGSILRSPYFGEITMWVFSKKRGPVLGEP